MAPGAKDQDEARLRHMDPLFDEYYRLMGDEDEAEGAEADVEDSEEEDEEEEESDSDDSSDDDSSDGE